MVMRGMTVRHRKGDRWTRRDRIKCEMDGTFEGDAIGVDGLQRAIHDDLVMVLMVVAVRFAVFVMLLAERILGIHDR